MTEPLEPKDDSSSAPAGAGDSRSAPAGADDPSSAPAGADDDAVRKLVKRAVAGEHIKEPDILRGVQRRLRLRSRGKFFADGWSTTQARQAYILLALVTLLLVAVAYYALSPMYLR